MRRKRSPPWGTGCTSTSIGPTASRSRFPTPSARCCRRPAWTTSAQIAPGAVGFGGTASGYASPMPVLSKTVEVSADAASIMGIVADFERYPQWNEGIKGLWVLARYDDGRPSQLRLDLEV